jgi:hypothetical protein
VKSLLWEVKLLACSIAELKHPSMIRGNREATVVVDQAKPVGESSVDNPLPPSAALPAGETGHMRLPSASSITRFRATRWSKNKPVST